MPISRRQTEMVRDPRAEHLPAPYSHRPLSRKRANPAPLGLSAFALTTFLLSLININTRSIGSPSLVVAVAYGYGGLVQLLAGMWEMALGNTFGATAFSSYGGFWLSFAIALAPVGSGIESSLVASSKAAFLDSFGLYLGGWCIFTFVLLLCTLRSSFAFFLLFFTLDLAFLMLSIGYLQHDDESPQEHCIIAGGAFGLLSALLGWYNALAGMVDTSNSFFSLPLGRFPWSEQNRRRHSRLLSEKHAAESGATAWDGHAWDGHADSHLLPHIDLGSGLGFSSMGES